MLIAPFVCAPFGIGNVMPRTRLHGQMRHVHLRVGLPPVDYKPYFIWPDAVGNPSGQSPDIVQILSYELGFTYEFAAMNMTRFFAGEVSYLHVSIDEVMRDLIDMTFTSMDDFDVIDETSYPQFTIPIQTVEYSIYVRRAASGQDDLITRPFAPDLWWALIGVLFTFAAAIFTLRMLRPEGGFSTAKQAARFFGDSLYHSAVTLLDSDDMEWTSGPAKLLRCATLVFTLVSVCRRPEFSLLVVVPFPLPCKLALPRLPRQVSMYTAQLTAFLVQPEFTFDGPTTADELKTLLGCFGNSAMAHSLFDYHGGNIVMPPPSVQQQGSVASNQWCETALMQRQVDYMGGAGGEMRWFLSSQKGGFTAELGEPGCGRIVVPPALANLGRRYDSILLNPRLGLEANFNLSFALMQMQNARVFTDLLETHMLHGKQCSLDMGVASAAPKRLQLEKLSQLFAVCGVIVALVVAMAVAERRLSVGKSHKATGIGAEEEPNTITDRIRALDAKIDRLISTGGLQSARQSTCSQDDPTSMQVAARKVSVTKA